MSPKPLRIMSITPVHPSPRDAGARSYVRITIDLGLKSGQLGEVVLSPKDALYLTGDLTVATVQATRANDHRDGG
jgi:hypothetical protein